MTENARSALEPDLPTVAGATVTAHKTLRAVSLFAGVGGIDLALERAGIQVQAAVEIDKAARKVLRKQFPYTTIYEDVRRVHSPEVCSGCDNCLPAGRIHVVAAGWPCQDLSVAGRRLGLAGERSGLWWEVVRLLAELRPTWFIGENVPGLLSACCPCPGDGSCGASGSVCGGEPHTVIGGTCPGGCMAAHGGAMGAVVGSLAELGYGFAYRVLDAQYFGVPQRRPRVVLIGHLGNWTAPAEVLLEPESSAGHLASCQQAGPRVASDARDGATEARAAHLGVVSTLQGGGVGATGSTPKRRLAATSSRQVVAALTGNGVGTCGPDDNQAQAGHLIPTEPGGARTFQKVTRPASSDHPDVWEERDVAATLSPFDMGSDGRAVELVVGALTSRCGNSQDDQQTTQLITHALTSEGADASEDGTGRGTPIIAFAWQAGGNNDASGAFNDDGTTPCLPKSQTLAIQDDITVRRLTPMETERLQGYPDHWTEPQADAPRYRQMGNSVAVPVFEWVARRLVAVDLRLSEIPGDGAVLNEHAEGVHKVGAQAVVTELAGDSASVGPERIGDADVA